MGLHISWVLLCLSLADLCDFRQLWIACTALLILAGLSQGLLEYLMSFHVVFSRLTQTCSHVHEGFQKKRVGMCKASWGLGLEQDHHHFCCTLLVKVQIKNVRRRLYPLNGGAVKSHCKGLGDPEGHQWNHLPYSTSKNFQKLPCYFTRSQLPWGTQRLSNHKCSSDQNPTWEFPSWFLPSAAVPAASSHCHELLVSMMPGRPYLLI